MNSNVTQSNMYPPLVHYSIPTIDYGSSHFDSTYSCNSQLIRSKPFSSEDDDDDSRSQYQTDSTKGNSSMKRRIRTIPSEEKDAAYFEKRARNNESAKRSREARRIKEQQIQERLIFLEHEHSRLLLENQTIRYQLSQYHAFSHS